MTARLNAVARREQLLDVAPTSLDHTAVDVGNEVPAALEGPPPGVGRTLDPGEIARRPLGRGPGQMQ